MTDSAIVGPETSQPSSMPTWVIEPTVMIVEITRIEGIEGTKRRIKEWHDKGNKEGEERYGTVVEDNGAKASISYYPFYFSPRESTTVY